MRLRNETDRRIVGLAIPALGTLAAEPLYRIVDTAIVGRLGTDQLAGIVSIVAVPALVFGARPLASAIGADGAVLEFAVEYLRIAAVGVPFVLVALAAQSVQRGASDYRTPLAILVAANVANLLIELVLVFGFDLGIAGAAWSTAIAQAGAGIAFLVVVRRHLAPARRRRPQWTEMAPLLTAGRHLLLRVGSMLAVFADPGRCGARPGRHRCSRHRPARRSTGGGGCHGDRLRRRCDVVAAPPRIHR